MRPHTGPQQQQQPHHQQQYCAVDICLKQQHFIKNNKSLQQHTGSNLQLQQGYHQHHLQQHVLQQQQPPPPPTHMWNPHFSSPCFSQPPTRNTNTINSSITPSNNVNLQSCRPFPNNRVYQHPAHTPHYRHSNGFSHAVSECVPLTATNYVNLPQLSVVNQQRINECAGIPLISTATAHLTPGMRQRLSRKQSHSPPGKNWSNVFQGNSTQTYASVAHYATAHVHGAPLMLNKQKQQKAEYWSPNLYAVSTNTQYHQQFKPNCVQHNSKQPNRTRTPLRYQNSAPASLASSKSKENLEQQLKHTKEHDNPSSNNGDSSNSNETCLPRIIKPRKRRKKDRKPTSNLLNTVYLKVDNKMSHDKSFNTQANDMKSCKSSEDLLKCLQKFTQINNISEQPQRLYKTGPDYGIASQNKSEPTCMSRCTIASNVNHGICFCNECDPLRSLWEYPLRRSPSDSSTSDTSGTSSFCETNSTSSTEFCFKTECNGPKARAEIVGVIGSKRNKDQMSCSYNVTNFVNNVNPSEDNNFFGNNILSGINFASKQFKQSNCGAFTNLERTQTTPDNMMLLPETAETLLTKSINEISKKLIETCSNESYDLPLSSCHSLSSFSAASSNSSSANSTCADFSNDSGIESAHINSGDDLVFNFDNLHITTTKLSMSPSYLSSASLSSSSSSSSTSSCGNLSMSSSPTVKFTSNFLTAQTSISATAASKSTMQQATPFTHSNVVMGTTLETAPTLDFLVDLNNNHLDVEAPKAVIATANKQMQQEEQQLQRVQFNDLVQNHPPPQQQRLQTTTMPTPTTHQHDHPFFNNCFDLMWQEHERQLGNNIITSTSPTTTTSSTTINNTNTNRNTIDQLISSALTSNNIAMSSFFDSAGALKSVFSSVS